jgi:cytochrome c-type biogenesis protein CcmH/NrfG
VDSARQSLALNSHDVDAYYALAAAEARMGRYSEARQALLASAVEERFNYVPWVLLGDLASRRGDIALARFAYSRAHALNPRELNIVPDPR